MAEEAEKQPFSTTCDFWAGEIKAAEERAKDYFSECKAIGEKYKGEKTGDDLGEGARAFNALWVNQEILRPAVFSQLPKAACKRRHKSSDQIANAAAMILTNALIYNAEIVSAFDGVAEVRNDYLLYGRGVPWLLYESTTREDAQEGEAPEGERVEWAHVPHGRFLHSRGEKWGDVWWVARKVDYTREEIEERWPDKVRHFALEFIDGDRKAPKDIPLWQIWSRRHGKVVIYSEKCSELLEEVDPPVKLDGFFPCPRPAYATLPSDCLFPVADWNYYRNESNDIDEMMGRVAALLEAAKTRGVYDANIPALRDLFRQRENEMVPVANFNEFAAKGGINGAMELFDTAQIVATIKMLLEMIANKLDVIYQKTGIADIMRSLSDPSETLGAQRLKAGFGHIRLQQKRGEMARVVTDMLQITGEMIAELYHDDTLMLASGVVLRDPPAVDMMTGQPAARQALSFPEMYRDDFAAAVSLLRNGWLRTYRIEIESDTTVAADEEAMLRQVTEIITALGQFMTQAITIGGTAPPLVPVMAEAVKMLARSFRLASGLEPLIDEAMAKMVANSAAPPPPSGPTKDQIAAMDQERRAMKDQADISIETERLKMEQQQHMADVALTQKKIQQKDQEIVLEAAQETRLAAAHQQAGALNVR